MPDFIQPDPGDLESLLEQLSGYPMPFGRFGPKKYPPTGIHLIDLPIEYLAWFEMRGFPSGRLGYLMRQVYMLKSTGCDNLFGPLRNSHPDRPRLRPEKRTRWEFNEDRQ